MWKWTLILFTALSALAPAASRAQSPMAGPEAAAFRPGDAVRVTVWGDASYGGTFDIGPDGRVVHPLYREILISGLTLSEAEAAFVDLLRRYFSEPKLILEPLSRIGISGEVGSPNIYTVGQFTTVAQAIALAGGATGDAKDGEALLIRDGREIQIELDEVEGERADRFVRSGDRIVVERSRSFWGSFVRPALSVVGSLASLGYLILRATDRI